MSPETLFAVLIVLLLVVLVYAVNQTRKRSRAERRRTDAATREMQRRVPESRPEGTEP
jgi:uncharacterized membrane protein